MVKKTELTGKALENVHKVVFLVNEYPGKSMKEITELFQLPKLDVNVAIWRAQDMGFLTVDESGKPTIHEVPDKWELGEVTEHLKETILYCFKRLARDEMDMEENLFGWWTGGYPVHEVMIAMKQLINDKQMIDYEIKEVHKAKKNKPAREETYTFYTLYENMEMRWGTKQFKPGSELK